VIWNFTRQFAKRVSVQGTTVGQEIHLHQHIPPVFNTTTMT